MSRAHLIWIGLARRPLRTTFIFLAIFVGFLLHGTLLAVSRALSGEVEVEGASRLVMTHKVSIVQALPLRYRGRIAETPGVEHVSATSWFGGEYRDARDFFPQLAVEPESYLKLYPEYEVSDDDRARWLATRSGAIVGRALAERFGWEIGERVTLRSGIYRKPDGDDAWELVISGIYTGARPGIDEGQLFLRHDYLEDAAGGRGEEVRWYTIGLAPGARAAEVIARLDQQFANSDRETKTSGEGSFSQSFAQQVGDVGALVVGVVGTLFVMLLLILGSSIAESVRERSSEWAMLKAIGFSEGFVLQLVLWEAVLLCGSAGGLGLGLAWLLSQRGDPTGGLLGSFRIDPTEFGLSLAAAVGLGLLSGALPALGARRVRVAEALGRP